MEERILNFLKDNLHKIIALPLGVVLLILAFSGVDSFFENLIPNTRYYLYLVSIFTWIGYWFYNRYNLPQNPKDRVGVIISIRTENDKQKIRVKNDFVKELKRLVLDDNLNHLVNIVLLNAHQIERANSALDKFVESGESPEEKEWKKINKKIHGHFFVWGDIKERQDKHNKFFLDLNALVVYNQVNLDVKKKIKVAFSNVWYRQISFSEKIEYLGFDITANLIFIAIKHMVGIACLVSGDPFLALKFHKNLENNIKNLESNIKRNFKETDKLPANLEKIKKELPSIIGEYEYLEIAMWFYYTKKDLANAKRFLNISLKTLPENYRGYLFKSNVDFGEGNPIDALNSVYEAKKYVVNNNGTWRYNLGFLLMYLDQFEEALNVYKDISSVKYDGEENTLKEVIDFNKNLVESTPEKIQCYFILGYLKLKKEEKYQEAYDYFNKFIEKAKNNTSYSVLITRARKYKAKLEQKMTVNNAY